MGVSDEDYEKMASVNSNSQLYKQFGNSIVVDVMVAIFEKLSIEQEKEKNELLQTICSNAWVRTGTRVQSHRC